MLNQQLVNLPLDRHAFCKYDIVPEFDDTLRYIAPFGFQLEIKVCLYYIIPVG
jgi:hypothetical protein